MFTVDLMNEKRDIQSKYRKAERDPVTIAIGSESIIGCGSAGEHSQCIAEVIRDSPFTSKKTVLTTKKKLCPIRSIKAQIS